MQLAFPYSVLTPVSAGLLDRPALRASRTALAKVTTSFLWIPTVLPICLSWLTNDTAFCDLYLPTPPLLETDRVQGGQSDLEPTTYLRLTLNFPPPGSPPAGIASKHNHSWTGIKLRDSLTTSWATASAPCLALVYLSPEEECSLPLNSEASLLTQWCDINSRGRGTGCL